MKHPHIYKVLIIKWLKLNTLYAPHCYNNNISESIHMVHHGNMLTHVIIVVYVVSCDMIKSVIMKFNKNVYFNKNYSKILKICRNILKSVS